jgi:hypothetical protein
MKNPYWDGKIHKQAKFGDIAIKGTVKNSRRDCRGSNSLAARQKRQLPAMASAR